MIFYYNAFEKYVPEGICTIINVIEENDAIFDCSWSETNENLILTCSGDGNIRVIYSF